MERSTQKNGLINLLTLLAVGAAGFAAARVSNTLGGQVSVIFAGVGLLVAAVSWFQMRLEENERIEKLEVDEMAKERGKTALFESKDSELYPARRSREQFERFFVPGFTVLLFLLQSGAVWLLWRWLDGLKASPPPLRQSTTALALFALLALVLFLLGRFSATFARLQNQRLLRPSASYMLLNAFLCALVVAGIAGVIAGFERWDLYVAYILWGLLVLVTAETLVNLVLEVYRPRVKGKVERPLYESRLVGLLGQPEGLITTAAQALDYQFGFKVSETWFYRFFEKALGWILLLQVGILLLSTSVVFIDAGEQGLLERFGKPVEGRMLLGPGAHLKWPWPIDRVYRHETEQIQSFVVGSVPEPGAERERAVRWSVMHTKEENFVVAHRETSLVQTNDPSGKRTPPVSLLTVSIPVQFQVTNLVDWAYNNESAGALLQDLATREVLRFLMGADMNSLMAEGRWEASQQLLESIQRVATDNRLGVRIVSLGLQDLHPPVKVAPEYQKVIGAMQTKQAKILAARGDAIRTNALAEATAVSTVDRATAERVSREIGALAEAARFTNQIPAFAAAPSVYAQRKYLEALVRGSAEARKYLLLTTNTQDVLTFDLQDKIREDLLNLNLAPKK